MDLSRWSHCHVDSRVNIEPLQTVSAGMNVLVSRLGGKATAQHNTKCGFNHSNVVRDLSSEATAWSGRPWAFTRVGAPAGQLPCATTYWTATSLIYMR